MQLFRMLIDLHTAVKLLRAGEVVALPTETVYGLGCLATDAEAIRRVYAIKNRPTDNPLICHVADEAMLLRYVKAPSPAVLCLIRALMPGPLSLLLELNEGPGQALKPATGDRPGVVMRIPEHPLTLELIRQLGAPLAAPSANTSGKVSPTSAQMVLDDLGPKVAGVLDGGPCRVGIESTIVDARENGVLRIVRPGVIGVAELQALLKDAAPEVAIEVSTHSNETIPGTKYAHYAPDTPIYWIDRAAAAMLNPGPDEAIMGMREDLQYLIAQKSPPARMVDLGSLDLTPKEVAHDLYDKLKSLDKLAVSKAWLLRFAPDEKNSVAQAVFNRLQKVAVNAFSNDLP